MQVFYGPAEDHLTYIVRSAIWHYLRHLEECMNKECSPEYLRQCLQEADLAGKMLEKARRPAKGSAFRIVCDSREEKLLAVKIFDKYLKETAKVCEYFPFDSINDFCNDEKTFITCRILPSMSL